VETSENVAASGSSPDASELIRRGRSSRKQGEHAAARRYFETAASIAPSNLVAAVEIATTLRDLDLLDDAEARYREVLDRAPDHLPALNGLAKLAQRRGDAPAGLEWHTKAADVHPDKLTLSMQVARTLRSLGRDDEAELWLRRVVERAPDHAGALTHLAEIARQRGEPAVALALYERAAGANPGSVAAQLGMAGALRDLGRFDEAETAYRSVLQASPGKAPALIGLGIVAHKRGNHDAALSLFEAAAAQAPEKRKASFLIVDALRRLGRFEEAGAILARLAESAEGDDAELEVRQFEHCCLTLQLSEAEKRLRAWKNHREVPAGAIELAAELYAALRRWSDVLAFFRERVIEGGWAGPYHRMIEPLARAARATGRYAEVCQLLDRLPDASSSDRLRLARDQIVEEMRLLRLLESPRSSSEPMLRQPIADPFRAGRAELFARVLQRRQRARPRAEIFVCTDAAYLLGAGVSLFSLMKHNMESLRDWHFMVFCADEVLDLGAALFGALGAAFATSIEIRASSALFLKETELRTEWGFFTPSRALSQAAYYRIYAARQLIDEGRADRALYLDADTCVYSGLDQLIAFDLARQPLGACLEDAGAPLVRRAARLLGLDPERYFNSGVLLFDLHHPDLRALLERAIGISLGEPDRLSFVDQCALNLAFRGKFSALPERFNRLVKPQNVVENLPGESTVVHFLAGPKPWDPMYGTPNCMPWLREFAGMSQVIASDLIRRLLALQYPVVAEARRAAVPRGRRRRPIC
jgi:lipopolysaccharide biosynthesis glycosyltransferase/tetratricopeptide (TPR) repeat protein